MNPEKPPNNIESYSGSQKDLCWFEAILLQIVHYSYRNADRVMVRIGLKSDHITNSIEALNSVKLAR